MVAEAASPLLSLFGSHAPPPPAAAAAGAAARAAAAARRSRGPAAAAPPPHMRRPAPEPTPQETDVAADAGESVAPRAEAAPLPPSRPYDLGPREASAAPKPPCAPPRNRALYFRRRGRRIPTRSRGCCGRGRRASLSDDNDE